MSSALMQLTGLEPVPSQPGLDPSLARMPIPPQLLISNYLSLTKIIITQFFQIASTFLNFFNFFKIFNYK